LYFLSASCFGLYFYFRKGFNKKED
jgi:hypothetical protein